MDNDGKAALFDDEGGYAGLTCLGAFALQTATRSSIDGENGDEDNW